MNLRTFARTSAAAVALLSAQLCMPAFLPMHVQAQTVAPPPVSSSPDITRDEIRHHVTWLASDALEGRGTGTHAGDIAAEYIAREFKRYGLAPAGENGTYFQTFEVVTAVEAGANNMLTVANDGHSSSFKVKSDFIPYSFSLPGSVKAPVVFAGWGIHAAKLSRDDYAGLDVKGKIVLVLGGNPEEDDPHSQLAAVSSTRSKAMFAREAGAAAVLIVYPDRDELATLHYDNSPSNAGIIVVNVRKLVADLLLASVNTSVAALTDTTKGKPQVKPMPLPGITLQLNADVSLVRKTTRNVLGRIEGGDPSIRDTVLVVGAHYDHLGWGQDGTLYKGSEPMIHHGADDNASGTAGMLELAQYFSTHPPRHSMVFMGFTGEEMGLLGSAYWTNNPTLPLGNVAAMFNLDMIGRLPDSTRKLNVQGTGTSPVWEGIVKSSSEPYKFDVAMIPDGQGSSDQASFYLKNIPVLFFFTGLHTDYHRPSDTADRINYAGEEDVTRFASDIIRKTDAERSKPLFAKVKQPENQRMSAFRVYVGTIPDYGANVEGFKISGTSPGGPAEKAGMKAGDIIVRFGDTEVKNIYDYMNALSLYKPGDDVQVVVKRDSTPVTLTVHLLKK